MLMLGGNYPQVRCSYLSSGDLVERVTLGKVVSPSGYVICLGVALAVIAVFCFFKLSSFWNVELPAKNERMKRRIGSTPFART